MKDNNNKKKQFKYIESFIEKSSAKALKKMDKDERLGFVARNLPDLIDFHKKDGRFQPELLAKVYERLTNDKIAKAFTKLAKEDAVEVEAAPLLHDFLELLTSKSNQVDGEEKEMLNKMIEKFGLKDFINICPPTNDVIKEYLNSSIYVMTSRFEGLPMVLIEAQACGLPIISFDCPTGPSFIIKDNVSGYLVEPGKIDLFAKKLIDLANDNLLIKNFGNAALKNAKKYSPEEISKLWNSLFIQLSGGTNYDS